MVCSSRSRNCRGIELSSRDFKTVAILVTRAKLYCINTWFACTSPSPEATLPCRRLSIRVSSQTPSFYTFTGRGLTCAQADQETVEVSNYRAGTSKLSQYRSLKQSYTVFIDLKTVVYSSRSRNCQDIELSSRDFKTVAISVTRGLKTVEHIEQGLENCRGIELSSRDLKTVEHIEQGFENSRGIELSSRDLKTVAISVTRALSNVAGKVIICDNNISASGGGMA